MKIIEHGVLHDDQEDQGVHDELNEKVNMMTEWVVDEGKRVAIDEQ